MRFNFAPVVSQPRQHGGRGIPSSARLRDLYEHGCYVDQSPISTKTKERLPSMSQAEILEELSRLSHRERREIIARILEMEEEAQVLADCDRCADERFLMLDAMEAASET